MTDGAERKLIRTDNGSGADTERRKARPAGGHTPQDKSRSEAETIRQRLEARTMMHPDTMDE